MIAVDLPMIALAVPAAAAAIGLIAWLLADTPDLQTRSSSSIGDLLSDATTAADEMPTSRPMQECA